MQRMKKYQLLENDKWVTVKKATIANLQAGWLFWEDSEGCTGLARPGTWREKPLSASHYPKPEGREDHEPECNCYCVGDQADASDCKLHRR